MSKIPKFSIKEVEKITGQKVVRLQDSKNWIGLILEGGVKFTIKK